MSQLNLEKIRADLENERAKLLERIEEAEGEGEGRTGRNPSRSDLSTDYASKDRQTALQSMDVKTLEQIDDALHRIANGTYGLCEECGQPIPPERLEILPYATLCVQCQEKRA